ncbi:MAG: thioredoxin domain-containing protein, partial [Alphaproteobacteria bacterium]|nr:thioredoxin domain-containing protein [Alphaproteobacteria bacterium]
IKQVEFKACIANQDLQDQVLKQRLTAEKDYQVDGAPTFFLEGKKYPGTLPLEEIDKVLSKKGLSFKKN